MTAVLTLVGLGLALVAASRFRRGATLIGVAMVLAAVLRILVPTERLGPLAVRSKAFDIAFTLGLAVIFAVLVIVE
jgi:Protein of unknown function (DUF3017)